MSLIIAKDVEKSFGAHDVLKGVSLTVSPGERVALLGQNGCGKSTLLRIIAGETLPDRGIVQLAKKARLGYLTQSMNEIGSGDAFSETAEGLADLLELEQRLENLAQALSTAGDDPQLLKEYERTASEFELREGYTWQQRVRAILLGLGLRPDALHRAASDLSGGERMRVALARLLLQEPDILLLDEPTNHLDLPATQWLEGFLRGFKGACLVVSHDRFFLDAVAQRVVEVRAGTGTEYSGNFSAYSQEKVRRLQEAQREAEQIRHHMRREEQLVADLKAKRRFDAAASRSKKLARLQESYVQPQSKEGRMSLAFTQPKGVSHLIAEAKNLSKAFGDATVLKDVSFEINGRERIGIIGPNGGGKTTLLRLLLGKEAPSGGYVRLGDWVRYGYLGQEVDFANLEHTVMDELLSQAPHLNEDQARSLLARFLFRGDAVFQPLGSLSGGEQSRLAFLCLVQNTPHCLLLDEPTNHLDIPGRECLEEALCEYRGTVIAISHDRFFLNRVATRILELRDGCVFSYHGNYNAYLKALTLGARTPASQSPSAVRNTVVTGGKQARKGKSFSAAVRENRHERRIDLEKAIATKERRLNELEGLFQDPGFYRQRSSHQLLQEHQRLLEELASLYAAVD